MQYSILKSISNQKGQGLIEYLILVALMGVACIGAVKAVQVATNSQLTNVTHAIIGKGKKVPMDVPSKTVYESKDMSEFMKGANDIEKKKSDKD